MYDATKCPYSSSYQNDVLINGKKAPNLSRGQKITFYKENNGYSGIVKYAYDWGYVLEGGQKIDWDGSNWVAKY